MRANTALVFAAASLVSQVAATIYVTGPVASTTFAAGTSEVITWNDDGNAPALATIGACQINLCFGDVDTQICPQVISPSLDVSQNAQIAFTPDPTIGGPSNDYFIKFISLAYKDPTNPQFNYTSFSAKFTLSGMTGVFNATDSAAIAGTSLAASTTAATVATTSAAVGSMVTTTAKASVTSTGTAKATTSAAKSTSTSGAVNVGSSMTIVSMVALVMGAAFMGM